ncbi:11S globulin seed storage protein 2 [Forsythia ovata]|uniref:11S globulin seed storage protein 2 n=1 Tax=Forsythia ovata TaxID=205694 RepID=A0ABD1S5C0_9LAMI
MEANKDVRIWVCGGVGFGGVVGRGLVDQEEIFFLAGNYPILGKERPRQQVQKEGGFGNIFTSFDDELLADSFNVDKETASELKGKGDHRGRIVLAESFKIAIPREEEEKRGANGLEETLCTMKIRENLAKPSE